MVNLIVLTLIFVVPIALPSQEWLVERIVSGDIDTLRVIWDKYEEATAERTLLNGLFESDAEKARFNYDYIVTMHYGSPLEAVALDRLWQYHYAKGDGEAAKRFYDFLRKRHPNYPLSAEHVDFSQASVIPALSRVRSAVSKVSLINELWTVQVGAFSEAKRADDLAKKLRKFGTVRTVERITPQGKLIAVQVGEHAERNLAEQTLEKIKSTTGLEGRIVAIE